MADSRMYVAIVQRAFDVTIVSIFVINCLQHILLLVLRRHRELFHLLYSSEQCSKLRNQFFWYLVLNNRTAK